ncbi:MAG: 50S ribosomal protein L11 [Candidatus Improbicoccus devescovinae]|nr:MAG: 50S ribosomal protein L11 [Candidatus Improbicoccus devescovinae]
MATKKVSNIIKLQVPGGKAAPASLGSALGPHGINIMNFSREFNEKTKNDEGTAIPVVITIYSDKSFTFITKTPPAAVLIKQECKLEKGSAVPHKTKVGSISLEKIKKIAEQKMPDLNAATLEGAIKMISGTARSMGVTVEN